VDIQNAITSDSRGDFQKGVAGAPIKIVEFADFECPACRRLNHAMKPLLEKYEGKYELIFRNYPIDNSCNPGVNRVFHKYACVGAFFSRCAAEQGKFWEALEFLFAYEGFESDASAEQFEGDLVTVGARDLLLDAEAIKSCLQSGRYRQKILQDIEEGNRIGLRGTPALWINGKPAPYGSLQALEAVFNKVLDGAKAP
jgi:protein-disulfide isomerase